MNRPDIIFIQAGEPDDLHPKTQDLNLNSMRQAHQRGEELRDRDLLPKESYSLGSEICTQTAEIMLRAAGFKRPAVGVIGRIAAVERYPLKPIKELEVMTLGAWLDRELAQVSADAARQGRNRIMLVAPYLLITLVDRLTADNRRRFTPIPHTEGFICTHSRFCGYYRVTDTIGDNATYRFLLSHTPL